jgi:hypothetical protein
MSKYNSVIEEQLESGIIEKVNKNQYDGIRHYIPHHAVIKPDRSTTKLRIVYDASAKTKKENNSLNECLHRGPVLLHDLCGTLLRFRMHNIGIVADIEKAFLQLGLQRDQRDVTRFLWLKDFENMSTEPSNIQEYRFCRVPFGIISSPFILSATVDYHLDLYETKIAQQIKSDIYMDNLITGAASEVDSVNLYSEAKNMFAEAKMNIREWLSSNEIVNESIAPEDKAEGDIMKVLGHVWDTKQDTLEINHIRLPDQKHITKRTILKTVASVYDPMGLFSPVTLPGKLLIQKLWKHHQDWDDELQEHDKIVWENIRTNLSELSGQKIARRVSIGISDKVKYSIVCFCDASSKAYAALVYLIQNNSETTKSDLLFSKNRLAPIKELSIPRLELMSAVIAVRCVAFVKKQLGVTIENTFIFSDSQCVLNWIKSTDTLPVFVKNRVKEIKNHSDVSFHYVEGKRNPADIASRGCKSKELCGNREWWHGPAWLVRPQSQWTMLSCKDGKSIENEQRKTETKQTVEIENVVHSTDVKLSSPLDIDYTRFSSITKLLKVTVLALRFIRNLKNKQACRDAITAVEMNEAETMWVKYVQEKNFGDVIKSIERSRKNNLRRQDYILTMKDCFAAKAD